VTLVIRLTNGKAILTILKPLITRILYNYKEAFRTTGQIS
jgi:hypothetical protein